MNRLNLIRKEEKKYHDYCYENYKLFAEGSWLYKPVKTIIDLLPSFENKTNLKVLDLGSGVGRNSIPIAKEIKDKNGKVICVDLLDSALEKLKQYSKEYEVDKVIETIKADIGHYNIARNEYDFIIAVSTLEHVESEAIFEKVIQQMALGTKQGGVNCIIINSEVEERDLKTNEKLDVMMEVNKKTTDILSTLASMYLDWTTIRQIVKPLEYKIIRDEREVLLKTNAITFVVQKMKS